MYPLLFLPVYKNYLWGGERIRATFGRTDAPHPCSESWEVSAHPDGMSVIENGPWAGQTLEALCQTHGEALLGSFCETRAFPLLVKIIDAQARLSVQVHPDEAAAERFGGDPKTEMWVVLDAAPDAFVCAGLKKGVTPRMFQDAIEAGRVGTLLRPIAVRPGRSVFVPGGLVHAIGEGCLMLEIQQNSNTTYRVHDWDRTGPDGRPRALHVRQALEVINWHAPELDLLAPIPMTPANPANTRQRLLRCDFFTVEQFTLNDPEPVCPNKTSFRILFTPDTPVRIHWADETLTLPSGRSCLIPAHMPNYTLSGETPGASVITVEL